MVKLVKQKKKKCSECGRLFDELPYKCADNCGKEFCGQGDCEAFIMFRVEKK